MSLVFLQPVFFWLLPVLAFFWFFPRSGKRNGWHVLLRTLVVLLLILGLARPALLKPRSGASQVVIWDRSESIPPAAGDEISERVRSLVGKGPGDESWKVIVLNGDRTDDAEALEGADLTPMKGSSISAALEKAGRLIPDRARAAITLISDGKSTDRQWGDAARALKDRGIPVHTLSLPGPANDVYPVSLTGLPPIQAGQTAKVRIAVVGQAGSLQVELRSGERLLAQSEPVASPGRLEVALEFEPPSAGQLDVEVVVRVLEGNDEDPGNNRLLTSLAVQEPLRTLYLAGRLSGSARRMSDLLGPGVDLLEPSEANLEQLAKENDSLDGYDVLVIDDRPAEAIPLPVQESIVRAVREQGIGLVYAGGKGVFGTGGYFDSPVAGVLPVEMVQKEEKRDPSTTLVVIIDTSGSMGGERVQLAKECARLAVRRLLPHDKVGIVEFYGTKQWAAPIQSAANAIDIQRALNRLDAGGGTVILPAIEEAFYALQNVQTRYKHVLVLTDGGVESGDFESMMRRMASRGINVSTVLVGGNAHSEFLVNLANWGKGHFYAASNRFSIPEILLKQPSTSKIPPYRPGNHPVTFGGSSAWWGEIPRPDSLTASGYVETRTRPGAQVLVETEAERHPLLASWRFGLGRATAMMTEPAGEGTAGWEQWEDYGAWLMRVVARTAREYPQPYAVHIDRDPSGARVVARRLIPGLAAPLIERVTADDSPVALTLQQRSPDVFTARIPAEPETAIHLRASAEAWSGPLVHVVSPAIDAVRPEKNVDPLEALDPGQLAGLTGGENLSLSSSAGFSPSAGGAGTARTLFRLWPICFAIALLLYLGDLLYRRWPGAVA